MLKGFYKKDSETSVLYAPNFVLNENYELRATDIDKTETVDGWTWFETGEEAYLFFNVEMPAEEEAEPWLR